MILAALCLLLQEPESRKAATNESCLECHESSQDEIKGSVHEKEGCIGCHGTDEVRAVSRGNPHRKLPTFLAWKGRNLTDDCGSCHTAILEALKPSKHYVDTRKAAGSMKKGCIDCHSGLAEGRLHAHAIPKADLGIINGCKQCHDPNSKENVLGLTFSRDIQATVGFSATVERDLRKFQNRPGISTRAGEEALARMRQTLAGLRTAQHGIRFDELEALRARSAEPLHQAYNRLFEQEREFESRWRLLVPFIPFIAAGMVLVILRTRKGTT